MNVASSGISQAKQRPLLFLSMAAKSRTGVGMAASFSEFLKSRALIPFDQIPQFERWVRMYSSRRPGTEGDKTDGASMNKFLAEIGTSHGPLKVAQARKALQLYSYFRSIGSGQFDFKAGHTVRSSGGWQGALIKKAITSRAMIKAWLVRRAE